MIPLDRICISLAALSTAAALAAQNPPKNFELPTTIPLARADNKPFASQVMRYQQWHSAAEVSSRTGGAPVRIVGVDFKAGSPGGQVGRTIDIEVTMANGPTTFSTASFDGNMVSGRTIVFPRARVGLGTATPGTFPLSLTFANEFVFDGRSGLVVDVKLFDNGNNNQAYSYDLELSIVNSGRIDRMWTLNDTNATFAAVHRPGEGITARFHFFEAVTVPYGQGCPGDGGFIPISSTSGGHPTAGNPNWTQVVTRAPSQRAALWFIGDSRTQWGNLTLPFELTQIGANGCFVLAKPIVNGSTMTVGGGAGAGRASLSTPLPPVTTYVGLSFFSQWLILDPRAPNGLLTMSDGLWHIAGL